MYSLEVWRNKTCRVLGASGQPEAAKRKAEDLAQESLVWTEVKPGRWEAPGADGSRYVMIEHTRG